MSNYTCEISSDFSLFGEVIEFENTGVIAAVHSRTPRLGHTDDIDKLIFGSGDDGQDYLVGVIASSILIFFFFLVWGAMLIGMKCLGPNRVGIFSGKQVYPEAPSAQLTEADDEAPEMMLKEGEDVAPPSSTGTGTPEESHEESREESHEESQEGEDAAPSETIEESHSEALSQWQVATQRQQRRLKRSRVMVLVCSLGITICVIIMIVMGVDGLVRTNDNAFEGVDKGLNLTEQAIVLVDNFIAGQDQLGNVTLSFISAAGGICPNIAAELCAKVTNSTVEEECDFTLIPLDFAQDMQTFFDERNTPILDEMVDFRNDLSELEGVLSDLVSYNRTFDWAFYTVAAFASILCVMNWFIAYGVISAWRNTQHSRLKCCMKIIRGWLVVPIFGLLVVITWVFSMVFVIGSAINADFCIDSPDQRMEKLLLQEGSFLKSSATQFLLFYISGCPADQVPSNVIVKIDQIAEVVEGINTFISELLSMEDGEFEAVCGAPEEGLVAAAVAVQASICNVGQLLSDVQLYFSCGNWRPLYNEVAYDTICYSANDAFYYISLTFFCIVLFAMIMLTLRGAFAEVHVDEEALGDMEGAAIVGDPDADEDAVDDQAKVEDANETGENAAFDDPNADVDPYDANDQDDKNAVIY